MSTLSKILLVIIGIPICLFMYGCSVYNGMAKGQVEVDAAWSDLSVQYQRRNDLLPGIVETVKGEARFEQETLKAIVEARASVGQMKIDAASIANMPPEQMQKFEEAQRSLSGAMQRLLVVVEKYPDLKTSKAFSDLRTIVEGTENRIGTARHRIVTATKEYNASLVGQPRATIAGWGNFKPRAYYEAQAGAEKAPTIDFGSGVK